MPLGLVAKAGPRAVLVGLVPELAPRLYGTKFSTPASLMAALSFSLLAVTTANYLLWVARALQRLLLPTAVGWFV